MWWLCETSCRVAPVIYVLLCSGKCWCAQICIFEEMKILLLSSPRMSAGWRAAGWCKKCCINWDLLLSKFLNGLVCGIKTTQILKTRIWTSWAICTHVLCVCDDWPSGSCAHSGSSCMRSPLACVVDPRGKVVSNMSPILWRVMSGFILHSVHRQRVEVISEGFSHSNSCWKPYTACFYHSSPGIWTLYCLFDKWRKWIKRTSVHIGNCRGVLDEMTVRLNQ